jgi:hypothetical protein
MGRAGHDIRYIVLSDLHLGDKDSVLTSLSEEGHVDPLTAGPALSALIACLRDLVRHNEGSDAPTLVLNGDMVELAFGSVSGALNTFKRLAELLFEPGQELCDRILFLPGNHDHHLWEMARETQYRMEVANVRLPEGGLPAPRHVTPLDPDACVPSLLLNTVLGHVQHDEHLDEAKHEVGILYPNMALISRELDRAVLLHHGHYVERLYHFFSRLRRLVFPERALPATVSEIEAENFAWIDFVWSLFGRSGGAGEDVQRIFDMLLYPERTRALAVGLAERTAPVVKMPFLPMRWMREFVLKHVFRRIAARAGTERTKFHVVCSPETLAGTEAYLFGPTFRQLKEEFGFVPSDLTFLFGHTHKPFERVLEGGDPQRTVQVYNSGGWVVDALEPDPAFGGSLLLLSNDLDVACLRVFNDGESDAHYQPTVRSAGSAAAPGSFAARVQGLIEGPRGTPGDPWATLSAALRSEVALRRRHHRERRHSSA